MSTTLSNALLTNKVSTLPMQLVSTLLSNSGIILLHPSSNPLIAKENTTKAKVGAINNKVAASTTIEDVGQQNRKGARYQCQASNEIDSEATANTNSQCLKQVTQG